MRRTWILGVVALLLSLATTLGAGEPTLSIRLIRIKGSGKAARPEVAKELESLRSKLEALPLGHARYEPLGGVETKKGASVSFELPRSRRLEVRGAPSKVTRGSFDLHLRVTREDKQKRVEVYSIDIELKDGEAFIQKSDIKLEDGSDLLLAVTPQAR